MLVHTVYRLLAAFVLILGAFALYCGYLQLTGNTHTVLTGELYRSAQLNGTDLQQYVRNNRIKTVINLRGENIGSPWYDEEVSALRPLGVTHIDFRMSSKRILSPARAQELIAMMAQAEKPILIHCRAGADRSGLAAALYLAAVAHKGEEESEAQLSIRYGHLSLPLIGPAYAMYDTFEQMEPLLGFPHS